MVLAFPAGEYFAAAATSRTANWKVTDRLGEIRVPALVVSGERDVPDFVAMATWSPSASRAAVLDVVADCGHLVPLERPLELATSVLSACAPVNNVDNAVPGTLTLCQ